MRPGRTPKPTAVKILEGNPGKRPLNDAEPRFRIPRRMPPAPDHLDDEGKKIWRRLGPKLLRAGLLTDVDLYVLGMFCTAASRWIEAERMVKRLGPILVSKDSGNFYQNPYLHVANRAWEQMRKLLPELGLSPAERSRLQSMLAEDEEKSLAELLFESVDIPGQDDG